MTNKLNALVFDGISTDNAVHHTVVFKVTFAVVVRGADFHAKLRAVALSARLIKLATLHALFVKENLMLFVNLVGLAEAVEFLYLFAEIADISPKYNRYTSSAAVYSCESMRCFFMEI